MKNRRQFQFKVVSGGYGGDQETEYLEFLQELGLRHYVFSVEWEWKSSVVRIATVTVDNYEE